MIKQTTLYASSLWTSCSHDNLMKIFKLQKYAVCMILNADTKATSIWFFNELGWIPYFHKAKIHRCAIIFKKLQEDCPYIANLIKHNANVRTCKRASCHTTLNLVCPCFKRESEGGKLSLSQLLGYEIHYLILALKCSKAN